jgi:hypothetical protein
LWHPSGSQNDRQASETPARLAKNIEAEDRCYQIRWRAATKAGELLKTMDKAKGGQPYQARATGRDSRPVEDHIGNYEEGTAGLDATLLRPKTLAELGISKQQSSDWQKLAEIDENLIRAGLTAARMSHALTRRSCTRKRSMGRQPGMVGAKD